MPEKHMNNKQELKGKLTEISTVKDEGDGKSPRYKFHPSNSGSLITFFKVARRSSTKLVTITYMLISLRIFRKYRTRFFEKNIIGWSKI